MKKQIISVLNAFELKETAKRLYRKLNFTRKIKVNNKEFVIPHIYGSSLSVNEGWMLSILNSLFRIKDGSFLDIGVNLGQTLIAVKSIDTERKYIGFEPNPACVFYVEELIRVNSLINCDIFPVGLYTSDKILHLDLYEDNITNSGGSIIQNYWDYKHYQVKRQILVPVFSFATIAPTLNNQKFTIIKIDVEGAELEVIQTLYDIIRSNNPFIIVEILSAYSIENKLRFDRQIEIENLLKSLNYKILRIVETKNSTLKKFEKIVGFDVNANPNDCNYILYHESEELKIETLFETFIST